MTRDVLYALRSLRRAPFAALTIVTTVALGLGLVTSVFAIYNVLWLRTDAVQNPEELLAVKLERQTSPSASEDVPFTLASYEALRRETSVFTDAFAKGDAVARIEDRLAHGALVSDNFFHVVGVQAALGRPLLPGDAEASLGGGGASPIVLSDVGWRKWFEGDRGVIGRRVSLNGVPHEIVGVMPQNFWGLDNFPFDYWAPLTEGQLPETFAGRVDPIALEVVGRLKPGVSPEAATEALQAWAQPLRVTLAAPRTSLQASAVEALIVFVPLLLAFGLILMIGCANVANLLLARGVSRQRDIGIRLSLGASRRRIISQLLTESLILSLAAAACGLLISRLLLTGAIYALITTLPVEAVQFVTLLNLEAPSPDWRVVMFLVAGAIVSTMGFGLAPALHATRVDPVRTMRGEVMGNVRPSRARHALIAVQVGASALLLICAATLLRSALTTASIVPGIRTSDTLRVSIDDESRRAAVLQALSADPLVVTMAASSFKARATIETVASSSRVPVDRLAVSSDYFDVLGIDVVSGRGFTPAERTADAGVAVVSEAIARQLWGNEDAVGQPLRLDTSRTVTVVGVVRDPARASGSYFESVRGIYVPNSLENSGPWLLLRVRGTPAQTRQVLLERVESVDPTLSIITLQTLAGAQAYGLQWAFWITVILGGIALVLTVSGLFSVLSYVVEQQAKEIGVRMALGAATHDVVRLVLSQSFRPVAVGVIAGGGLAAAVAIVLMAADAEVAGWINVFDPLAYAASVLVIVTSCALAVMVPALRAARIDPIATLRKD